MHEVWSRKYVVDTAFAGVAQDTRSDRAVPRAAGCLGAALIPMSAAVLFRCVPPEQHRVAPWPWGIGVVLGPTLGPMLGGGSLTTQLALSVLYQRAVRHSGRARRARLISPTPRTNARASTSRLCGLKPVHRHAAGVARSRHDPGLVQSNEIRPRQGLRRGALPVRRAYADRRRSPSSAWRST